MEEVEESIYLFSDNGIVGHIQKGGKGTICSAYAIFNNNAELLFENLEIEKDVTNNYGEMKSMRMGLLKCIQEGYKKVKIYSDSELCVKWLNGEYKIKNQNVMPAYLEVKELLKNLEEYSIKWISRDNNLYTDWLTADNLKSYRKTPKKIGLKEDTLNATKNLIKSLVKNDEKEEKMIIDMDDENPKYVKFIKEEEFNKVNDIAQVTTSELARLLINEIAEEITEEEYLSYYEEGQKISATEFDGLYGHMKPQPEEIVEEIKEEQSMERVKNTNMEEVLEKIGYEEPKKEIFKPNITLPKEGKSISRFTEDIVGLFKNKDILFFRPYTNEIVEVGNIKIKDKNEEEKTITGFVEIKPSRFITVLERYALLGIERYSETEGWIFKDKSLSKGNAETVLDCQILQDGLPQITRIFTVPLPIIHNGNLTFPKKGYDERFNSWLPFDSPEIKEMKIEDAKKLINEIYKEFCFKEEDYEKNLSVAIAGLLTPFLRGLFSDFNVRTPLFFYIGNRERTGKDCCAGVTGVVYEGEDIQDSPISTGEKYGNENEELRKKFTGALMSGRKRMHFSNCKGHINNSQFENMLTNPVWRDRIMQVNKGVQLPNEIDFSLSGNAGITYERDLAERSRFIKLFFAGENINERVFEKPDLHLWVKKNRSEILSALFALVKNWFDKGSKQGSLPFTSFPEWANFCGGIMEEAGYVNPCVRDNENEDFGGDVEKDNMKQIYEICFEEHPNEWIQKNKIFDIASNNNIYSLNSDIEKSKFMKEVRRYINRELSNIRLVADTHLKRVADHSYKFININNKVESQAPLELSDEDRIDFANENTDE